MVCLTIFVAPFSQFWSDRYLTNRQFNYLFKGLNFPQR